jgi:UDP-N-acetylglucosamine transferase subunit ALG13
LIDAALRAVPNASEIIWQTGSTDTSDLPIKAHVTLTRAELDDALDWCDVVIAHAGVGSAMSALDRGKCPILVPRLRKFNEHVDDHQTQIAAELASRGLVIYGTPETLSRDHLEAAYGRCIVRQPSRHSPVLTLSDGGYSRQRRQILKEVGFS